MTVEKAIQRINDLKEIMKVYHRLYNDSKKSTYLSPLLLELTKKSIDEVYRLEECIQNNELEDSYNLDIY